MQVCLPEKCTGCGMCTDICPKQCIHIEYDKNGFLKHCVDTQNCVKCGLCQRICPINTPASSKAIFKAYKAVRTSQEEAKFSTSGGIASALAEYVISIGGFAYGAIWDGLSVRHNCAKTVEEAKQFRGSKYLGSFMSGCYTDIKDKLEAGATVLFIGTPCQNAALKNSLRKSYEALFMVDFVCHGVSSKKVFDRYLKHLESVRNVSPISVNFRDKSAGYDRSMLKVLYEDGSSSTTPSYGENIGLWFASGLSVSESCHQCIYATQQRVSDITLADFIGNLTQQEKDCGVSTVFINTSRGEALFEKISTKKIQLDLRKTLLSHERLNGKKMAPCCRKKFFKEIETMDFSALMKKYTLKRILPGKIVLYARAIKRRLLDKKGIE